MNEENLIKPTIDMVNGLTQDIDGKKTTGALIKASIAVVFLAILASKLVAPWLGPVVFVFAGFVFYLVYKLDKAQPMDRTKAIHDDRRQQFISQPTEQGRNCS
ncbi:MAG: hypothetical protein GY847_29465 [Proteobacteria bacterium]|nr:hypothetical protein [Pseudomonadota bacterium]